MQLKQLFLGTSALIGAGLLAAGLSSPAAAAEVRPGGALNIEISGFVEFQAHGGDLDDARLDEDLSKGLDFSNDTEVHVLVRGKHETTGIEYGGTVEFEADTNRTDNTDETWLFLRGGFGEVRLGDDDGIAENSAVGAHYIAAGTGGLDGDVVDTIGVGSIVYLTNSDDATKILYYTPSFGGFQAAVSYTPNQEELADGTFNGDLLAGTQADVTDLVEAGLIYDGEVGGFGITASVVGTYGQLDQISVDEDIDPDGKFNPDDDDFRGIQAGLATTLFGFRVAGSYATEEIGPFEREFFNAGIGWGYGPLNLSVNYGQILDYDDDTGGTDFDKPYNLVFSADYTLMPGLTLAGDVGYFDNDFEGDDGGAGFDDNGWQAIAQLGLAF